MKSSLEKEIKILTEKRDSLLAEIVDGEKKLREITIKRLNSEQFMKELSYRESNLIRMYAQAGLIFPELNSVN